MIKIKIRNNNIKQWSLMRRLIQSPHQIHHPETNRSEASLKLLEPTVRPAPRAQTAASGTIKLLPQDVSAKIGSLFCLNTSINSLEAISGENQVSVRQMISYSSHLDQYN